MNFVGFITILVILFLVFVGFVIYFFFKSLEFLVKAINLYEKMINRQDMIIKLLSEKKSNGKNAEQEFIEDNVPSSSNHEYFSKNATEDKNKLKKFNRFLRVTKVKKGSQAENLGIKVDDIIESYDGTKVSSEEELKDLISVAKYSGKLSSIIVINRENKVESFEVTYNPLGLLLNDETA